MSGLIKGVGKVFKAVVNVVKKVALPVLAIGAVVLTGGAALGALPALSTMVGSLGLSPALTGILVGAAKGATAGFIGGVLTGSDPLKAAGTGMLMGGALSGIGAVAGLGGKAATTAAQAGTTGAGTAAQTAGTSAAQAAGGAAAKIGGAVNTATGTAAGTSGIGSAIGAGAPAAAPSLAATTTSSGGFLGWLNSNPVVGGSLLQGIGSGISANAAAARERERDQQINDNYLGYSGLNSGSDPQNPYPGKVEYDPQTGRIRKVG